MVCDTNEKDLNISIAAVMLPLDAGSNLEYSLLKNSSGRNQFNCCGVMKKYFDIFMTLRFV